jgi:carboxypeptidase C (cathepsin A)
MRYGIRLFGWLLSTCMAVDVYAAPTAPAASDSSQQIAVTRGAVGLRDGRHLSYTARAGYLPLVNDETREDMAHVYFVAYTADAAAGAQHRPLTFVFPGGPGSAATLSHDGPRSVVVKDGEAKVVDNPDTMLGSTDLVLVDPVGTGYSRVTNPKYTSMFYGIKPDVDSLVEFMRSYIQRFDPVESPVFLSGGSWGSVRSILVADAAINRGIPVQGIMISAEGAILSVVGTDTYYTTLIPGFTLVAHTHHKLAADLQADRAKAIAEAQKWANTVYLPAISQGNHLSDAERRSVAAQMARLTGLGPDVIEAHNLKITQEDFTNELLRDEGKSIGFYDTRITGPAQNGPYDATKDPSLMARGVAYPKLAERYLLNRELGMRSNDYYAGPFGGGWPVKEGYADWMSAKWGMPMDQEPVGVGVEIVLPTFVRIVDKGVRVLIGQGSYDWACPPFGAEYVASRVSAAHKKDVTVVYYESGHGVPEAKFAGDVAVFLGKVLKEPAVPAPRAMVDE